MRQKQPVNFNSRIEKYFIWPLIYIIVIFSMAVYTLFVDVKLGVVFVVLFLVSLVIGYVMNRKIHKHLMSEVMNFALSFSKVQRDYLYQFEVANIILDSQGRIRWFNDAFKILLEEQGDEAESKKILEKNINTLLPLPYRELLSLNTKRASL